jgi:hypothetical protein
VGLCPCRSSEVQSSRVAAQLAGPAPGLRSTPHARFCVQSFSEEALDLAVCIPSEQPHRPRLSHLKGSVHFEILPCESEISLRAAQVGRIDFRQRVCFQRFARRKAWIDGVCIRQMRERAEDVQRRPAGSARGR